MPTWVKPYKIRRSNKMLSYAVRQNFTLLETGGEACYLLQRKAASSAPFQRGTRRVDTISKAIPSGFGADPDMGALRYLLWQEGRDEADVYPDVRSLVCTVTVPASGTAVWEATVDKYSFIDGEAEYTVDIFQDELDSDGNPISDAVYLVFNTPPFTSGSSVDVSYGTINPLVNFAGMQPVRDNQEGFQQSLFGFDQWRSAQSKIRKRVKKNAFLLAFPGVLSDFRITDAGLLRETRAAFWTTPPPYSPKVEEHDVIIRASTSQRFQVVNYTPIYIEDILVSQEFDMVELDPRSTIYNIDIEDG